MSDLLSVVFGDGLLCWQELVVVVWYGVCLELLVVVWVWIDNVCVIVCCIVVNGECVYGISIGFGVLCDVLLEGEQFVELLCNILFSYVCGVGELLCDEQIWVIICVVVVNYSQGKFGFDCLLVEGLLVLFNYGIILQVLVQGLVGYLIYMVYVGIVLFGIGEVSYCGSVVLVVVVLVVEGLVMVCLGVKDGFCLVNGMLCMIGFVCLVLDDVQCLVQWVDVIGVMSFEVLCG